MSAKPVTKGFIGRFGRRVKQADSGVWLASAWITPSKALDGLLDHGRRVKALVGIHGNATDPDAIQSLIDAGFEVRIVVGGALFHPKLYLFRRSSGRTMGWIGSVNFTGAGFAGNRELILEFDTQGAITELESWFRKQWSALRRQDVKKVLRDYRMERDKDDFADLSSIVEYVSSDETDVVRDVRESGETAGDVPRPARLVRSEEPKYIYTFFGVRCGATSRPHLVQQVLAAFHDLDEGFLDRFGEWDRKQVEEGKRGREERRRGREKPYIAKSEAQLNLRKGASSLPLPNGWKLANQFEDYHHFQGLGENTGMLRKACELVELSSGVGEVAYEGHVYRNGGVLAAQPPSPIAVVGSRRQRTAYWR